MQAARYIAVGFDDSLPRGLLIKNTKEGDTVLQLTDHCSSIQLFGKGHMAAITSHCPRGFHRYTLCRITRGLRR